jgi:hypothetical protein
VPARDAYGLSKWLATTAGLAARPPLEVDRRPRLQPGRAGQPGSQALGRFADLLNDPGPDPLPLTVGDLDARRDFIDVRDVARASSPWPSSGIPAWSITSARGVRIACAKGSTADRAERPQGRGRGRSAPVPRARARRLAGRSHQAHDAHGLASGNRVGAKPCGPLG